MSVYFTEEGSVDAVNGRMGQDVTPRLAEVMAALVKHLHAFAKEVDLTQSEWEIGIDFLTRTGQIWGDAIERAEIYDKLSHLNPLGQTALKPAVFLGFVSS
jgi:hypothetical protein